MGNRNQVYDRFISDTEKHQNILDLRRKRWQERKDLTLAELKSEARKLLGAGVQISYNQKPPRIYRLGYLSESKIIWVAEGYTRREALQKLQATDQTKPTVPEPTQEIFISMPGNTTEPAPRTSSDSMPSSALKKSTEPT